MGCPTRTYAALGLRVVRAAGLTACTAVLLGCAAQNAYRSGNELMQQGNPAAGLAKLEEAARLEPRSAEYRIGAIQARERVAQAMLLRAEGALAQGDPDAAQRAFKDVLALRPGHQRATDGLRAVENQRRWALWIKDAEASLARKDVEAARAKLHALLNESPRHPEALRLQQRLEEQNQRPVVETALSAAYRKPISIEFKDAPLRTVFEVISRTSGLNFLFDKDVKTDQKSSIYLRNSTIEAAVNLTLLTNQLEQRVLDANTLLIYPNTPAKQKDYQPLTVRSFYLANAEAKSVAAHIKTLVKTRDVVVDEKLNLVIVRDSPEAVRLAEKVVALLDVSEPEVMLDVEILEVKRTRLLGLGIQWPDQLSLAPLPATSGGSLTLNDLRNLDSSRLGAAIGPVTIHARKTDSDANILANPRIRVRNREKAKILIGERVPNITATSTSTGFVSESVSYVDVGLKLDVEPTIYLDNEVAIKVSLEVSNIITQLQTKSGSLAYQIGTRTATTVLRLKDGENQVLAGLINDEDRRSANKVPGLGEIPIVGRLFGTQTDDGSKTEIVLSITPRILRNVQRPEAALLEFDSGTETSLRSRVLDGAVSSSPEPTAGVPVQGARPSPAMPPVSSDRLQPANPEAAASGTKVQLRWQGPTRLRPGDTFALQLTLDAERPILSMPLEVEFDPGVLQVVAVSEGDLLRRNGGQTQFTSRISPTGSVSIQGVRSSGGGVTGSGVFATIHLRVLPSSASETVVRVTAASPMGAGALPSSVVVPPAHVIDLRP